MFKKQLKDALCILRSRLPIFRRLRLLVGLMHTVTGRGNILGWNVAHLGRDSLRLLYSEIFARQNYRFTSIREDPVILDCGANIGMATFYFKWLYPRAQIASFEPDPLTFQVLKNNVINNGLQHVAVHNVALAGEQTKLQFYVPEGGSLMMSALPSRAGGKAIQVPAKQLSSFITGEVDLLKLDIEGMEGPVLRELEASGKLTLIREMVIEVHHNLPDSPGNLACILQLLERAGFKYHIVESYSASADCAAYQDVLIHATKSPDSIA